MTESQNERGDLPSASAFRRYELCNGSWQLEQEAKRLGQVAHERSVDATRGDLIHAWLAGIPDEDGKEIKLSESEQTTADFLQERAEGEVARIFGDQPTQQLVEKRLWLTLNGKKALSGRFDRVTYTPTVALVQDFKTGWAESDPAEINDQLKVLAVLVGLDSPLIEEVYVQIVSGPFGITQAHYDLKALGKAYHEIIVTLRSLQAIDAPLNPSPEACRYCPATNICPALKDLIMPVTKLQYNALPEGADAANLLDTCELLDRRLTEIRAYYYQRLIEDPSFDLPGYALVPGIIRREVTDWDAARMRLGEYLDTEEIKGAANYRLGELEKALGKKLKLKGKDIKERMGEILHGLIEERPNTASLKRVSGKKLVPVELP